MYTVRIEDGFAAAHFLTRYHGRCESLHGHNNKVFVTAAGLHSTTAACWWTSGS